MVSLIRGSTFRARQSYVASPSYLRGVRYSSRSFRSLPFDHLFIAIAKIDRDASQDAPHGVRQNMILGGLPLGCAQRIRRFAHARRNRPDGLAGSDDDDR